MSSWFCLRHNLAANMTTLSTQVLLEIRNVVLSNANSSPETLAARPLQGLGGVVILVAPSLGKILSEETVQELIHSGEHGVCAVAASDRREMDLKKRSQQPLPRTADALLHRRARPAALTPQDCASSSEWSSICGMRSSSATSSGIRPSW